MQSCQLIRGNIIKRRKDGNATPRIEPGAAGREAEAQSIVLCAPPYFEEVLVHFTFNKNAKYSWLIIIEIIIDSVVQLCSDAEAS